MHLKDAFSNDINLIVKGLFIYMSWQDRAEALAGKNWWGKTCSQVT
jgi:hypothetical protein